jgi:hypothetical protein
LVKNGEKSMFKGIKSFKKFIHGKGLRLNLIETIRGIMVLAPMVATAENPNPGVLPVESAPFGKTYGEWSEEWWKWILSIPSDRNPLSDDGSGEFCAEGQSGKVWFLAGSWVGTEELKCEVPAGKALFFPIINTECSKIEGYGRTEQDFCSNANSQMDTITETKVTVDGKELKCYRVESKLFVFKLPSDNVLEEFDYIIPEFRGTRSSPTVSDGYWIMLAPLSKGKHVVCIYDRAGGVMPDGSDFETEMTYNLNVK